MVAKLKDPVTSYAHSVVDGKIPAGKLQRLACQRHLIDLKRKRFEFEWKPEISKKAIDFFPNLTHWRGRFAGEPFHLLDWQMFCAGSAFGWVLKSNPKIFRFRTMYIEVPKKSGKSTWVAGMGIARGFFSGEQGAETYSLATKRDQALIVWNEAAHLIKKSENASIRRLNVFWGRGNMSDTLTSSKFEALGADKDSSDGLNPVCVIADEVHRYKDAHLLNTLRESMAARENPLIIEITTAGWDKNSICYEHHEYSIKLLERAVENDRWFAFIACADAEDRDNWDKPKVWEKSNPSWGVMITEKDTKEAALEAASIPSKLNDFLRFRLNIWTEQAERAIDIPRWIESGQDSPSVQELRGLQCFGGLDLASNKDLCALVLVFPTLPDVAALAWFWCPEEGVLKRSKEDRTYYDQWVAANLIKATPGDTTDHRIVRADILAILEHFDLMQLAYDPHNSGNLPHELAEELGEEKVVKFYQGFANMAAPVKEIERLYLEGHLKHGNNPVLNWMASNAAWRINEYNDRRFDREKSSEKIDGMVALAMGVGAWLNNTAEPSESVYDREDRGLLILGP